MMEHELYDVAQHTQPSNAARGPPRHAATRVPKIQLQLLFNNSHIRIEASQCNSYSSFFFPLPYFLYSASPPSPHSLIFTIYTYRTELLPSLPTEIYFTEKFFRQESRQFKSFELAATLVRSILPAKLFARVAIEAVPVFHPARVEYIYTCILYIYI